MKQILLVCLMASVLMTTGCSAVPKDSQSRAKLNVQVQQAIEVFRQKDPKIESFLQDSYGYAVLPRVTKGAFWVGAAYGQGQVFQAGRMVAYCNMSQATLGFSFGGEFFREIIFFKDQVAFNKFMQDEFTFSAQATAVALKAGAAAKADYKDGMLVFILTDAGLMVDASLGGQKFNTTPVPYAQ